MIVALLQFELLIPGSASLKDKRRVVRSVKDTLHREHQVSVAEVGFLDHLTVAGMALSLVNRDGRYAQGVIDTILDKLRKRHDCELGSSEIRMLHADEIDGGYTDESGTPLWSEDDRRLFSDQETAS